MRMNFRAGTIDSIVFEAILKYNEYQLPLRFSGEDIIIDIGAHVGFFTYAVVQRGCGSVHAFEPDIENYNAAVEHLKLFLDQGQVFLTQGAVWRSDIHDQVLYHGGYFTADNIVNTGGGNVVWPRQGNPVPAIPFDTMISSVTEKGQKRIRLLKLDCEGSEWPILLTSKTLHLVDEICGEFHEIGGEYDLYTFPFLIEGVDHFTIHHLTQFLQEKGFDVRE